MDFIAKPFNQWVHQLSVKKTQKKLLSKTKSEIAAIFSQSNPFSTSLKYRTDINKRYDPHLIYGSLNLEAISLLIGSLPVPYPNCFVDFGCGDGQAMYGFLRIGQFKKVIGIEALKPLYQQTINHFKDAKELNLLEDDVYTHCILGNFFDFDNFSEPMVILFNANGYFGESWQKVKTLLEKMNPDSIVIVISQSIKSSKFEHICQLSVPCSWGVATATIYKKLKI